MRLSPCSSTEQFRLSFVQGLKRLLDQPELGSYVLVHTNASLDTEVAKLQGGVTGLGSSRELVEIGSTLFQEGVPSLLGLRGHVE